MRSFDEVLERLYERVAAATAQVGLRVDVPSLHIADRRGHVQLDPPTRISPNRACRMVRAADGWIAVNLARQEDRELTAAWLHGEFGGDHWEQVERLVPDRTSAQLVSDAILLGLPACAVGEVPRVSGDAPTVVEGPEMARPAGKTLKVVDLSAMWAGPMCGAILAAMGADVIKIESSGRPDPTRTATPEFFQRLNGAKTDITADFSDAEHRAWLREEVRAADVVISSARPRGLASLGLHPKDMLHAHPGGVWVSITGYGWYGSGGQRVAFGDDAAAAGGLVRWTEEGEPHFLGDALADPLTGMAAAASAITAVTRGAAGWSMRAWPTRLRGPRARLGCGLRHDPV